MRDRMRSLSLEARSLEARPADPPLRTWR